MDIDEVLALLVRGSRERSVEFPLDPEVPDEDEAPATVLSGLSRAELLRRAAELDVPFRTVLTKRELEHVILDGWE